MDEKYDFMKILTIATTSEGYFDLLAQSASRWGYDLHVLGWHDVWKGFAWKLELYMNALSRIPIDEPVICVDGYDVVANGPSYELQKKFKETKHRIVFSGQRYFPNQRWMRKMADQVMSIGASNSMDKSGDLDSAYNRPCMGLVVGYAGELAYLFQQLIEIERRESINDDQTLLNMYYSDHPEAFHLDKQCSMFQNLWRTRAGLYGQISARDEHSEVEVIDDLDIGSKRTRNKQYGTAACFLHAPFNLDMDLLLRELGLDPPPRSLEKGWHYWRYSVLHHTRRALKMYFTFN